MHIIIVPLHKNHDKTHLTAHLLEIASFNYENYTASFLGHWKSASAPIL